MTASYKATREILDAAIWTVENRRELVELAYGSDTEADLRSKLAHRFGFSALQCDVVTSAAARRLTKEGREALLAEREDVRKNIESKDTDTETG